ncbi:MAG: hypothetical protein JSS87_07340 [Acidobacteria bacterium]|nr:hypothetical protein [Acidobacteriota bacterium]
MFGFGWSVFVGIALGFGFGVGCALAVMYSIFMGGYRAAIREARMEPRPERYVRALERVDQVVDGTGIAGPHRV